MSKVFWPQSPEESARLEQPLIDLDSIFGSFCHENKLTLTKNDRKVPSRQTEFGGPVRCLIQLFYECEERLLLNLWVCASLDKGKKRFWKTEFLAKAISSDKLITNFSSLLVTAKYKLDMWSQDTNMLEFAVDLPDLSEIE